MFVAKPYRNSCLAHDHSILRSAASFRESDSSPHIPDVNHPQFIAHPPSKQSHSNSPRRLRLVLDPVRSDALIEMSNASPMPVSPQENGTTAAENASEQVSWF
jgi:hypothetical protein